MLNKKLLILAMTSVIGVYAQASQAVVTDTQFMDQHLMHEASEGPRGGDNERPGDRHRRGGRNGVSSETMGDFVIAREASEGPRGGDNERPGDRHRRGGRNA